ncbi:MAG: M20/M25/M40 family metallo-hydrolase [Candidatus Roizmanbacteria bacterium]|nr:MAG: M20/M25/M40 family metallo-hydrolase [Candidatus Roizmanbacteria bacterium]
MNKTKILQELSDFIAIESVSTDPNRFGQIINAVELLAKKLKALNFEVRIIKVDKVPPLIVAFRPAQGKPEKTIAVYAHYDVQPEDPIERWKTPPFKLVVNNGKILGRGIADDKGHLFQNIVAVEELINDVGTGRDLSLQNNIIFIFEGEEETGSSHLEEMILKAKETLAKADVFYITDVGMHEKNIPQIFYGLRGIIYFELEVETGEKDLHSGVYGNRVLNPILLLSELLSKIKSSETGKINIPHFYDDVRTSSQQEIELLEKVARTESQEKKETGTYKLVTVDEKHPHLSTKTYPSFDPHGIWSGFTEQGLKTVIPNKAAAKFSFRLVENQEPEKIEKLVKQFIKDNLPEDVKFSLKNLGKDAPFYTDIENPYIEKTAQVFKEVFNHETLINRSGGSISAAEILQRIFKKPVVLTGFTLPGDNIHSPNENFDEEMFWKGIEALKKIYSA